MKKAITFLSAICFLSVALSGQNAGRKSDPIRMLSSTHAGIQSFKNHHDENTMNRDIRFVSQRTQQHPVKSMLEIKQKLDFMIFEGYDGSAGEYVNYFKEEFIYNSSGKNTQLLMHEWDGDRNEWFSYFKSEFSFDDRGNKTKGLGFLWDPDATQWVNSFKEEMDYDENNNLTNHTGYNWIDTTGQWKAVDKDDYTYNSNGKVLSQIDYVWNDSTSQWIYTFKVEDTYEGNDSMFYISYDWDKTEGAWIPRNRTDKFFDATGNVIRNVDSNWDDLLNQWIASYKTEITYDANGNVIRYVDFEWDEESVSWLMNYRDEYIFDSFGNLIRLEGYSMVDSTNQWSLNWKTEFAYDNTFSLNDLILPDQFFLLPIFNHKLVEMVGWYLDDSLNWVPSERYSFLFSEININGISDISLSKITVFPNPATDVIILESDNPFESSRFELTDMQGRRVVSEVLNGTRSQISVAELSSGIYFFEISHQGKVHNGKIMIR